ncbi:MAG: hypothetical protein J1E98_11290 [Lachnospiraceae bacterium]|nr:hypothetical protein [Lachnospiraceae bacterium]
MKLLFEYITSSFSLFEDSIKNYIFMALIGALAFSVAYKVVGELYSFGIIYGRGAGHVLHWIIRLIVFVVIYYVLATIIRIYNWFNSLPDFKWWVVGAIITLLIFGGCVIRYFYNKTN